MGKLPAVLCTTSFNLAEILCGSRSRRYSRHGFDAAADEGVHLTRVKQVESLLL